MTDGFETSPARQPTVSKSAEHAPIWHEDTEWMARYWARERLATRCQEAGFPDVAETYRRGDRDELIRDDVEAFRAGVRFVREQMPDLKDAVEWISENNNEDLGNDDDGYQIIVELVAALFDLEPHDIVYAVTLQRAGCYWTLGDIRPAARALLKEAE